MKTKFNEFIQSISAFICTNSICVFQLILLIKHRDLFSFISFIISIAVVMSVQGFITLKYSLTKIKDARETIYNQLNDCDFKRTRVDQVLSKDLLNNLLKETLEYQFINSNKYVNANRIDQIKNKFIYSLIIVLVTTPVGKIITPSAFTDANGQGYLFLKDSVDLNNIPALSKFRIFHEISHSLFLSFSLIAEQILAPITYQLLIIWIPFQLNWSWESGIAFIILFLLAFDTWGSTYWSNVERTLLQSEINADLIAAKLLSNEEKESLLETLAINVTSQQIPLADKTFDKDQNYVRFRRLLNYLNTNDEIIQPIGIIAPVSNWDFTWRALLIILLSIQSHSANWLISALGVVLVILFIALWVSGIRSSQRYRFQIEEKIGKQF